MKILDRLPFGSDPHILAVGGGSVDVHRNQIIVWISIDDASRPFPAILDTGHGHNLSIGRKHLEHWSGAELERIGVLEIDRKPVIQYRATVHIHRNIPGKTGLTGESFRLEMPQGISVMDGEDAPRLPLLGLRTIIANKLRLLIDGDRRQVTLKTKRWY